jgi:hypothetical protein
MKDILQDIISHTHALGFLNIVKLTGSKDTLKINSMDDSKQIVMLGEAYAPVPDLDGVIGLPQLNKLKFLLECPEYKDENAKLTVTKRPQGQDEVVDGIHFENAGGDFKNDYKFMGAAIINDKLKDIKFNEPNWALDITPSVQGVQRFQYQASANPEHLVFQAKTNAGQLTFTFGDPSAQHGGEFVFSNNLTGKLTKSYNYPVTPILAVLKMADVNNTKLKISDERGAIMIELDSGIARYKYIIPALT